MTTETNADSCLGRGYGTYEAALCCESQYWLEEDLLGPDKAHSGC